MREHLKFLAIVSPTIAGFTLVAKVVNHSFWSSLIIIVGFAVCACEYIVFDNERGGNWDD